MKQNWVLAPLFGALAVVACSGGQGVDDAVNGADVDEGGESSDELRRRKRDAGASSAADARVPDARVPDARVRDAEPTPTASDDPFEAGSCLGPSLTSANMLSQFGPYVDSIAVGKYEIKSRGRACNASGCNPWANRSAEGHGSYQFVRAIAANRPVVKVRLADINASGACSAAVESTPLGPVVESGYATAYYYCTSGSWDPRTCYGYCLTTAKTWTAKGVVTATCMRLVAKVVSEPNAFGDTYEQEFVIFGTPDNAATP